MIGFTDLDLVLDELAEQISQEFIQSQTNGSNLNSLVEKAASVATLTPHQVARVCHRTNNLVNISLHKEAKANQTDHRFTFDMADFRHINEHMHTQLEPTRPNSLYEIDQVGSIDAILPPVEKTASYISPDQLAMEVIRGKQVNETDPNILAQALTISIGIEKQAKGLVNDAKLNVSSLASGMHQDIREYIMQGETPSTLQMVINSADVPEDGRNVVSSAITKVASDLGVKDGFKSQDFVCSTVDNPLVKHASCIAATRAEYQERQKVHAVIANRISGLKKHMREVGV